jgi:hypothetical protein
MSGRSVGGALALLVLVASAEDEVSWYGTDDGAVRFPLPGTWDMRPVPTRAPALLSFDVRLPPETATLRLDLYRYDFMQDDRAFAYHERETLFREAENRTAEVSLEPVTHLTIRFDSEDGTGRVFAIVYRWREGNGVTLALSSPVALWPSLKDAFLEAGRRLECTLPPSPPVPPGYSVVRKGDYLYLLHPDVENPAKVVAALHKTVSREEGVHLRRHGPLPPERIRPLQIVVHRKRADARPVSPEVAAANGNTFMDHFHARLYTVTPTARDAEADIVSALHILWYVRRYGSHEPWWFYRGERQVSLCEAECGKRLPWISPYVARNQPAGLECFETLLTTPGTELADFDWHAFSYLAFFMNGPEPYRAAFRAFQAEFQASGDWKLAQERHLLSMNQSRMRADAQDFCARRLRVTPSR